MKHIAVLFALLLSTTTHAALEGTECEARSEKMKESERVPFMKSCLENARKPENVKEIERRHKSALCEQNAKNMKLQGSDKSHYETNCVNRNEAAIAASAKPNTPTERRTSPQYNTPKITAQKAAPKQQKSPGAKKKVE